LSGGVVVVSDTLSQVLVSVMILSSDELLCHLMQSLPTMAQQQQQRIAWTAALAFGAGLAAGVTTMALVHHKRRGNQHTSLQSSNFQSVHPASLSPSTISSSLSSTVTTAATTTPVPETKATTSTKVTVEQLRKEFRFLSDPNVSKVNRSQPLSQSF
jgi:hypothetical protein